MIPICNAYGTSFRNYNDSNYHERVAHSYKTDHGNMTYDFVCKQEAKWLGFTHGEFTIWEIMEKLNELIDESDPDVNIPNVIHFFQTAESIRKEYPDEKYDWFHLVGLLHDLGKIMSIWGEPQWCVVGDTYPVGCKFSDKIVLSHLFLENLDQIHPIYSDKLGNYSEKCGIEELKMAWGHDEYMYQVLKKNGCTIPDIGLKIIRYHSFYSWHTENEYKYFEKEGDEKILKWVRRFNKFDLYSKSQVTPLISEIHQYYNNLLIKYNIANKIKW